MTNRRYRYNKRKKEMASYAEEKSPFSYTPDQ